jgi:hypothetical protein
LEPNDEWELVILAELIEKRRLGQFRGVKFATNIADCGISNGTTEQIEIVFSLVLRRKIDIF